jgi:DNA-binding PadR family transcriptional regulator
MTEGKADKVTQIDGKSPVRAAVLAAVIEQPSHGWDVARRANRRLGSASRVDPKHVYSYLERLQHEDFVRIQRESFDRPPYVRDVYYPTLKGEEARREWLATPLNTGIIRTDLEVRLVFSTEQDIPVLLRALSERREEILEEIEENAASHTVRVSYLATIINLQRSSVDKRLKAEMEWIEEASKELEAQREQRISR